MTGIGVKSIKPTEQRDITKNVRFKKYFIPCWAVESMVVYIFIFLQIGT